MAQAEAGADILDVNVSTFGIDDPKFLPQAVQTLMDTVYLPLCIDSSNAETLAEALKVYKGKPLLNSVTGEERSFKKVLPLVKRYGAAVTGLVQYDEGIPKNAERRVSIAHKIVNRATAEGIRREGRLQRLRACASGYNLVGFSRI